MVLKMNNSTFADIDHKIVQRLGERAEKEGPLSRPLVFYQKLLDIQSRTRSGVIVPAPDTNKVAMENHVERGLPLLGFDDLILDWKLFQDTLDEVISLLMGYPEVAPGLPESVKAIRYDLTILKKVTRDWFERKPFPNPTIASSGSGTALEFAMHAALRPFLMAYSEVWYIRSIMEGWHYGYCPVCAGSPDFAYLDKERGARWLLCSRCDTEWLFRRLECPYCANQDQDTLAYFTDEGGRYRLYVCERCRRYLKAIDLRNCDYEVLLPLERFLTLDMDGQAQQDRYSP
jgi:formate dehydrogenase maturation protein FdhE